MSDSPSSPSPEDPNLDIPTFQAFVRSFAPDHRLKKAWALGGGFSASMTGLEIIGPGNAIYKLIARQHGPRDLAENPDIALDEYRLFQALAKSDLPLPRPIHLDQTCDILPVPAIVLEYVEGSTILQPDNVIEATWELAEILSRIHTIIPGHFDLKFLTSEENRNARRLQAIPERLDLSLQEDRVRDALTSLDEIPRLNEPRLLHGDFWPGNVIWNKGVIAAVIDWENVMIGDPVEDLANARMEILFAFGYDAMLAFTEHYLSLSPLDTSALSAFDLLAALRPAGRLHDWAITPAKEQAMRNGHKLFVDQAVRNLESGSWIGD